MAEHLRTALVRDALAMALQARRPSAGCIQHSDHGCQDTALAFGQRLQEAGIHPSMGSDDNAVVEAFFSSLTIELLDRQVWSTRVAAGRRSLNTSRSGTTGSGTTQPEAILPQSSTRPVPRREPPPDID
jgi:transposase InsO family protein